MKTTKPSKKLIDELVAKRFKEVCSMGGKETLRRHGIKHFSSAGKKGMQVRWAKRNKNETN